MCPGGGGGITWDFVWSVVLPVLTWLVCAVVVGFFVCARYKTAAGLWAKGKTAHGCHLNEDWKRNPAFLISCPIGGAET